MDDKKPKEIKLKTEEEVLAEWREAIERELPTEIHLSNEEIAALGFFAILAYNDNESKKEN